MQLASLLLIVVLIHLARARFSEVPRKSIDGSQRKRGLLDIFSAPPKRPERFHSREELKQYLQKVSGLFLSIHWHTRFHSGAWISFHCRSMASSPGREWSLLSSDIQRWFIPILRHQPWSDDQQIGIRSPIKLSTFGGLMFASSSKFLLECLTVRLSSIKKISRSNPAEQVMHVAVNLGDMESHRSDRFRME